LPPEAVVAIGIRCDHPLPMGLPLVLS